MGIRGVLRRGSAGAAVFAAGIAGLALAPAAHAAFPGANGKIAFVGLDGNQDDAIFTVNPDGSGLSSPLTSNTFGDDDPGWSADGTRIVFTRNGGSGTSQVWVMNADGTGETQLTAGGNDCQPAFLPDGRVVFVRSSSFCPEDGDIWIRAVNGTETQLTTHPAMPLGSADTTPTGSPDNQTVAFQRGDIEDSRIFAVSAAGGVPAAVTTDHTGNPDCDMDRCLDANPNYLPSGGTIAFDRCPSSEGCGGPLNIARVAAGGGAATLLTGNSASDPDDCQPAYAPDGTRIVLSHMLNTTNCNHFFATVLQLAFIPSGGGALTTSVGGRNPDWQPVAVSPTPPSGGSGGVLGRSGSLNGRCFNEDVTIRGTDDSEKIVGTPGNDVIRGFRGDDKINGMGGEDILCGGRGEDKIFGKKGNDILIGGDQSDFLNGGPGINRLFGGTPGAKEQDAHNVCVIGHSGTEQNCQEVR